MILDNVNIHNTSLFSNYMLNNEPYCFKTEVMTGIILNQYVRDQKFLTMSMTYLGLFVIYLQIYVGLVLHSCNICLYIYDFDRKEKVSSLK